MLYWLLVIILAYLFFAFASLGDKLVLAGRPNPKSYTFYIGIFSLLVVLLIPFLGFFNVKFVIPSALEFVWVVLDALALVAGLYSMFYALERFDVSKVVATIGATQPIFVFILTWIFWNMPIMPVKDMLAFVLLFLGSVIISFEKNYLITLDYIKIVFFSSLMFSFDYIFSKMVFLSQPFLSGFIWIRIFIFLFALFLLIPRESRKEIFSKELIKNKKTQVFFLSTQVCGAIAIFLQSFAIYLTPIALLALVNSLRGIQYVFLFALTVFISSFYPKLLKEELLKKIFFQKTASIFLIAVGLFILIAY